MEAPPPEREGADGPADGLDRQVCFEILRSRRRRDVLHYLFALDRPTDLRELSEQLAAWENDVDLEAVTYKQRSRVYTALRQNHLPKMDDEGVVQFDPRSGSVEATGAAGDLRPYLELDAEGVADWTALYLGLCGLCGLLALGLLAGLGPLTAVPAWLLVAVPGLLFLAVTLAQRRLEGDSSVPIVGRH